MAIEPHINNMIQKLDGFWLNNNAYVHAEFTRNADGTHSITLAEPVPYDTLPRPKLVPIHGCTHIRVPAFNGELFYGILNENGRFFGFFVLASEGKMLITASFSDLPPIRKAEAHGTHLILETMYGDRLRVIPSEDCTSLTAEIL